MTNLYQLTVSLFYQLANAFFWPVAVALLALLTITLIDLGGLFFTFWRKRRESRSDLRPLRGRWRKAKPWKAHSTMWRSRHRCGVSGGRWRRG